MRRPSWYVDAKDKAFIGTLNNELSDLWRRAKQQGRKQFFVVRIPATGLQLSHRLGRVPSSIQVRLKGDATYWEYQEANASYVYLMASAEVQADVTLVG